MRKKDLFLFFLLCMLFSLGTIQEAGSETATQDRFQIQENGTVIDSQTELMWASHDNGADVNWDEAVAFCQAFNQGGYNDWRLPNQRELMSLFDGTSSEKYKIFSPFTLTSCCPWTSDTRRTEARSVFFLMGERAWYSKTDSSGFRVLPVRTSKKNANQ